MEKKKENAGVDEEPKDGSMQSWDEKNKREEKLLEKIAVFTHASLLGLSLVLLHAIQARVSHLLLLPGKVQYLLLNAALHDELEGLNGPSLTKTMNTVNRLSDGSWVVLGLHDKNTRGRGKIQAHTTGTNGCQKNFDIVVLGKFLEGPCTCCKGHGTIKAGKPVKPIVLQGDLNEIQVRGPRREHNTLDRRLAFEILAVFNALLQVVN